MWKRERPHEQGLASGAGSRTCQGAAMTGRLCQCVGLSITVQLDQAAGPAVTICSSLRLITHRLKLYEGGPLELGMSDTHHESVDDTFVMSRRTVAHPDLEVRHLRVEKADSFTR